MNAMCGDFVELVQLSFAMAHLATLRRLAVGHHRYRGPWRGNRRSAPTIDLSRGIGAASGGSGRHSSAHNNRLNHKSVADTQAPGVRTQWDGLAHETRQVTDSRR